MAVDITARARTPGARKSTGSSPSIGSTSTSEKKTSSPTGMPRVSSSDSPRRRESVVSTCGLGRQGAASAHGASLPGQAEEHVLQVLAAGPEVGQGQVLLGQPGREGGHGRGAGLGGDRYSPGVSSVTGAPSAAPSAATSSPAGAPKRISAPGAASSARPGCRRPPPGPGRRSRPGRPPSRPRPGRGWPAGRTTPASRCSRTTSRTSRRPSTSSPAVGSSRNATWGRPTRARASDRRCCCAAREAAGGGPGVVRQPDPLEQRLGVGGVVVVGGEEAEDLGGADAGVEAALLEHHADAADDGGVVGERVVARAPGRRPRVGRR